MIKKRFLVTALSISMCLSQTPSITFAKTDKNSTRSYDFKVETNQSTASKYGYIKPAGQSYAKNPKTTLKKADALPSSYGSTTKATRSQSPFGTCWAFAGTAGFEYAVDKKTGSDVDYSEEHMIQRLSKNGSTGYQITDKDNGGNELMYSGYFASGMGPVKDELFPYNTSDSTLQLTPSILNAPKEYRATNIQFFDATANEENALSNDTNTAIKQAIYENGSATCGITWDSNMLQSDQVSYYNSDDNARDLLNHEITIVGWNDDYSKDHFQGVSKNGAWLIRNSWGSNVGDNGYFWVSYQDKSLVPSCSIQSYETIGTNDTIYNLDEGGALYPQVSFNNAGSHVGFVNAFSFEKREKLKEVTFYESETGASYQIFYVPMKENGTLDMNKRQALTEKETLAYPGYHTEKITKNINVKKAAIMVMIDSNQSDAGFGAEGSLSDGSKPLYIPTLEQGQSYIYVDDTLMDLYDMDADFGNWSIKLVTDQSDPFFYAKDHEDNANLGSFSWTGNPICPEIGEILSEENGTVLEKDTDYELVYSENVNAGTAHLQVQGLGDYKNCTLNFTYTIKKEQVPETPVVKKQKLTSASNPANATYTGKNITPNPVVKSGNKVLIKGKDYKISYKDNKNCGIATIVITGSGNYEGKITKTFKILPKKAAIKNLKAGKKMATISITKNGGNVTGYQICYSYKKNFKSLKYKTSKSTTYKIKGLTSKKYIYVKVRAYKQLGKEKIYGSFSSVKKVKIK